jgi:hypothetical protein
MEPPKKVLTPQRDDFPSRLADVVGTGVVKVCPTCKREANLPTLILAPVDTWPNQAIVCGQNRCGIVWVLGPVPHHARFIDEGGNDG